MDGKVTLKIPRPLYDALKKQIAGTGFASVTELAVYVLRDLAAAGPIQEDPGLNRREIDQVRKRLKQLGYL